LVEPDKEEVIICPSVVGEPLENVEPTLNIKEEVKVHPQIKRELA